MASANNTFEESLGLITSMDEILQDPEMTGTSIRTISMRLRNTAGELEELGEDSDGAVESITKLQTQILNLTSGKVNIMSDADTFRSTYDIIVDLSKVWGNLSDVAQADLTRLIAGVRQGNAFNALLSNMQKGIEATDAALNSENSALDENEKYLDSVNGRLSILSASFEKLSSDTINSEFIKAILNIANAIVVATDKVGIFTIALTVLAGVIGAKTVLGVNSFANAIYKLIAPLLGLTTASNAATTASMALSVALPVGAILGAVAALNYYVKKQKEAINAAVDESKALKEQSDSVEEYKNKINELRTELDSGNLTQAEAYDARAQLLEIQDILISQYGFESDAVNTLTGDLNNLNKALDESTQKRANDWLTTNYRKIKDARSFLGFSDNYYEESAKGFSDAFVKFGGKSMPFDMVGITGTYDEIIKYYQSVYDYIQDNSDSYKDKTKEQINDVLSYLEGRIADTKNAPFYQENSNLIDEAVFNTAVGEYGDYYNAILKAQSEFNDAMASGDQKRVEESAYAIKQAKENAISQSSNDEFASELEEYYNTLTKSQESYIQKYDFKKAIESNPTLKSAAEKLSSVINGTNISGWTTEQQEAYNTLSEAAQEYLSDISQVESYLSEFGYFGEDMTNVSRQALEFSDTISGLTKQFKDGDIEEEKYVAELSKLQTELKTLKFQYPEFTDLVDKNLATISAAIATLPSHTEEITKAFEDASEATKTLISSTSSLRDAFAEQKENGKLSVETMLDIIDAGYGAALAFDKETGAVTINKDAFLKLAKAKIEEQRISNEIAMRNLEASLASEKKAVDELTASYLGLGASQVVADMGQFHQMESDIYGIDAHATYKTSMLDKQNQIKVLKEYNDALSGLFGDLGNISSGVSTGGGKKEKTWAELQQEYYEDYINDIEHAIFLLSKQKDTEEKRAQIYKQLQEFVHEQAQLYRSKGYDENSEYIQSLQKLYWQFADEIKSIYDELAQAQKDAITESLDLATRQLDYQIFVSESMMNMFEENSDAYKSEADKQIGYYKQIQEAAQKALDSYKALGLAETDELVESAMRTWWDAQNSIIDAQKEAYQSALDAEKEAYEARKEAFEQQQDAVQDLLDATVDLIEKEKEDQIDALNEQVDLYEEIVNAKKESLQATKDEYDYQKSLQEKITSISDLENRIAELSLDDSREAQAEKSSLLEELAELQSDLEDTQHDKSVELQEDALDKELDEFTKTKEAEISVIEDYLSRSGQLVQDAMNRIESGGTSLYQNLMDYNSQYGDGIQTNVISMWEKATAALAEYGSVSAAIAATMPEFTSSLAVPDYSSGVTAPTYSSSGTAVNETQIIEQMKANSAAWHSASDSDRTRLHEANKKLAAQLGLVYERDYNQSTGKWIRNGLPLYHKGLEAGFVGGSKFVDIRDKENLAILQKGELVITKQQLADLATNKMNFIKTAGQVASQITSNTPINLSISAPITVSGDVTNDTMRTLKAFVDKMGDSVLDRLNKAFSIRGGRINPQLSAI